MKFNKLSIEKQQQTLNIRPKRILVITLRYLGDTLLVTPLISSLRQAYPEAVIDVLLPAANSAMLAGNHDINQLIPMPNKPGLWRFIELLYTLFRSYDLAISTQAGDRPILCALVAGKISLGFVSDTASAWQWKARLLDRSLVFTEQHSHAVLENLRFCKLLEIKPSYTVNPPRQPISQLKTHNNNPYIVLHIMPQWRYKQWTNEGWIGLAYYLQNKNYQLVLTGSKQDNELVAIREISKRLPPSTINLAGKLAIGQLTELISHAEMFIGPDTGITHLAAATGTITIALFGPTDPRKWGPWPRAYSESAVPYAKSGVQSVQNVTLVQFVEKLNCVPCQQEGCEKSRLSASECLDKLPVSIVIKVIEERLQMKSSVKKLLNATAVNSII